MFNTLPTTSDEFMSWDWSQIEPYTDDLLGRDLSEETAPDFLRDWSQITDLITERYVKLYVGNFIDTRDEAAEAALQGFLETVYPAMMKADNDLTKKFLASGITPDNFDIPLRNMREEADIFREENLPLQTEHTKHGMQYNKIIAAQTVEWQGEETTMPALVPIVQDADRETKEKAWRLSSARVLEDREAIGTNWTEMMGLRKQIADNADSVDYRAYMWRVNTRFGYTPEDCETFHRAIEEVVVPATKRMYERRRVALGYDTLRPWDVSVDVMRTTELHGDPHKRPPLEPFADVAELEAKGATIFNQVDPVLGGYFQTMRDENLLHLPNQPGKAPGAFCTSMAVQKRPYVVMNAVGMHGDVQTLFHEIGHAFHGFERAHLPYHQQRSYPMEFAEVASMAMELLASPYLTKDKGGFYTEAEAARGMIEHLESNLVFWPYMAVVDAFQHWAYTNHAAASDPANCDAKWGELWDRYIQGVDWSGLDEEKVTGWHRKQHIHRRPFYYVEYGLAQLGAVQIWGNALEDQAKAVADYRKALALGGTVALPELFSAAGVKFAFDADTLGAAVELIESQIEKLEILTAQG